MNARPARRPIKASDENRHHVRAQLIRHRILRGAVTLGGASDMATAMRLLSVLSRDGELDGYRIVTRGQR